MATQKEPKVEPREGSSSAHRYSLRETSKVPSRYRDYVEEGLIAQHGTGGSGTSSSLGVQQQQFFPISPRRQRSSTPRSQTQPQQPQQHPKQTLSQHNLPPPPKLRREQPQQAIHEEQEVINAGEHKQKEQNMQQIFEVVIGAEQEIGTSSYNVVETKPALQKPMFRYPPLSYHFADRRYTAGTELSDELKINLRKLKNVLKLPKARRFVFCEFFYSGVDQQIFLAENEFSQLMRESFPNLKCTKLKKPEWREVRRLIGKPRRCSQAFLNEERDAIEAKRQKIRSIYNGTCTALDNELIDLPAFLPRPPIVGQKIYARVRSPKDGIYAATVDAITEDGYRVVFDKDDQLPPSYIKDYEVMFDQPTELLALNYFIEQNRANMRGAKMQMTPISHFFPASSGYGPVFDSSGKLVVPGAIAEISQSPRKVEIPKDEKVGNFPVRMLVILVKLCKVIEYKKTLVSHLTTMNDYAEKMNILGNTYPDEFKLQFAQVVIDLETVNKLFHNYLSALQPHYNALLPHLNEPQPTDRPEVLRKTCNTHAYQIVKHCNSELNVHNKRILHLITSLTSILMQLRTIGAQKKKFSAFDRNFLSESLKQIRTQILPQNAAAFQDYVEIHMRQILMNKA